MATLLRLPPAGTPARIFIALDGSPEQARQWVSVLSPLGVRFKVGMELFYQLDGKLESLGLRPSATFLDLKLHDIPNTVAGGLKSLAKLRPAMLNVHCTAGPAALRAAAEALAELPVRPWLLGVTVLTALSAADLEAVGFKEPPEKLAVRLARLAQTAGLDGVVCSAGEIAAIKKACGADFMTVVPGVRPAGAAQGDQQRVATPGDAIAAGADFLVIGRPVTAAADPAGACTAILREIAGATNI